MSREDLIESWGRRGFPGRSDAHLKWAPISGQISQGSVVYIIGIGAGGLLSCIHNNCKVYGVDLPGTVSYLGQSFVNYRGAFAHPDYSTRPITWLSDLSLLTEDNILTIQNDLVHCRPDAVIIDIDRVDPVKRLELRYRIAKLGFDCWARVYSSKESILDIIRSVDSLREDGDNWWEPDVSVGLEVIVGKGARPLGLFHANGLMPVRRVVHLPASKPTWDELVEFVFTLGGNIQDTEDVGNFIFAKSPVSKVSPFDIYTKALDNPDDIISKFGRFNTRLVVYTVPWYL